MSIPDWKKVKRTGNFRRKVKQRFEQILQENCTGQFNQNVYCTKKIIKTNSSTPQEPSTLFFEELENRNEFEQKVNSEEDVKNNWIVELANEDSDTDNETNDFEKNLVVRNKLRSWATTFRINQMAFKELIQIWNQRISDLHLPDPRTLLRTPRSIIIENLGENGQYWHQGAEYCIKKYLENTDELLPSTLSLNINMDGLPIYKSSKQEFWPILANIYELQNLKPMVIGIFCGYGKPNDVCDFLQPFVNEMKVLINNGIIIRRKNNDSKINVRIRCFICDSPARAFIKGVANFNAKNGCLKCTIVGEYSYISHTTYFPRTNCPPRTDEGFRSKLYGSHHKYETPLTQLPIDMIEDFPVSDSLHLIDLGIMKKCLIGWRDGSFGNFKTKWSARDITNVTNFLLKCKMPIEIHRKVRGVDCLAHWKAVEYHTFLHYLSVVVLKEVLSSDVYEHFLLLFCAITICSSKVYFKFLSLAEELLNYYVELYRDFYGEDFMTSNVHNLSHLVTDVKKFGELNSFNTYPFESKLYEIKNLLRNGNRPLIQAAKRLQELTLAESEIKIREKEYPVLKKKVDNVYLSIELKNFTLSSDNKNKWFLTNNNKIVQMHYIVRKDDKTYIYGRSLKTQKDFFSTPIKSSYLNIYSSNELDLNIADLYDIDIKCKLVAVSNDTDTVFLPLLHTLTN